MSKKALFLLATLTLSAFLLSGCIPKPYTIDIPQGNLIDESKLAEVKVGLEPRQVRYLLGSPLITDSFKQNRWDYFYSVTNNKEVNVEHHVTIYFADGKVSKIEDNLKK